MTAVARSQKLSRNKCIFDGNILEIKRGFLDLKLKTLLMLLLRCLQLNLAHYSLL